MSNLLQADSELSEKERVAKSEPVADRGDEANLQDGSVYFRDSYDSKARFCSYWHQIHEILALRPQSVLEIGIGNGFVSDYLRKRGYSVTTVDIDEQLNPDYVGSVLSLPFEDESFDVVACFEVLEHIPYESFSQALREMHRVSRANAVLSIPDSSRAYPFWLRVGPLWDIRWLIRVPRLRGRRRSRVTLHFWEIGLSGYPIKRILDDVAWAGFEMLKTYRLFEQPWHRFFVLARSGDGMG